MAKAPNDKASKAEGKPEKGKPEAQPEVTDKVDKNTSKADASMTQASEPETKADATTAAPGEKVRQKPRDNKPRVKAPYVRRTGREEEGN